MELTASEQATLALDLLTLKKLPGYGETFRACVQDKGLNPVTLFLPFEVVITFTSYPTQVTPTFTTKDALGCLVTAEVVRKMGDWSASPLRLFDILTLFEEVIVSGITEGAAQEDRYYPTFLKCATLFLRLFFGVGIVGLAAFALLSLPVAFGLALLVCGALLCLLRPVQTVTSQTFTKKVFRALPSLASPSPSQVTATRLLDYPITQVTLPAPLLEVVLRDYTRKHHPNEYAFYLSGLLTAEGTVEIVNYYPSSGADIRQASPIICETTYEYNQAVTYDWSPRSHVVLVWCHIQPCKNLSVLDTTLFAKVAAWDKEFGQAAGKRSIAMTIDSIAHEVRFYDVHSLALLPHRLESEPSHV